MNERQRRDFNAGLGEEVDAWLRGESSRREFLSKSAQLAAMIAASGSLLSSSSLVAWAAAELADPSTPLGQAQAAAVKASTEGPADGSAFRAVDAAKKLSGVTLNMTYEEQLQALDPRNFSGPLWQDLTGIATNVVELPFPDLYSKAIAEHIAVSGAYDILDISPAWVPALADGGVIAPIDDYMAKYMNPGRSRRLPSALQVDAGPTRARTGASSTTATSSCCTTARTCSTITSSRTPTRRSSTRTCVFPRPGTNTHRWRSSSPISWRRTSTARGISASSAAPAISLHFFQQFRSNGGVFFDEATMKSQIASEAGIKTLRADDRPEQGVDPGQQ